jgi:hypothetical protein
MIKKIIRAVLKIPLTPFVVPFNLMLIVVTYLATLHYWLYEASDFDKHIIKEVRQDYISNLKNWFTTI